MNKEKVSENCIYCISRMPNGNIIVDANKRATIVNENNFEIIL